MTIERALELLEIEKRCILKSDTCDRKCSKCELVQDTDELLDMYDWVINRLSKLKPMWDFEMENVKNG